jgi:putative ABC transport system substrate-binding protein
MKSLQRSAFLAVVVAALAAWASIARVAVAGPPGHVIRVGVIDLNAPRFDPAAEPSHREFIEGMQALGYAEGRNFTVEFVSAENRVEKLPELAAGLVNSKPDMIVAWQPATLSAVAKATQKIPIVMVRGADVVETGLVKSLARPGGNITGLATNAAEIAAKRVQLLQEAVPKLTRVAVLWNTSVPSMQLAFQNIEKASPTLGVTLQSIRVAGSTQFDQAFAALEASHPEGLIVLFGPLRGDDLPRIVEFVTQHKIPTIFEVGRGVRGGGLMEFGSNTTQLARRAASYVDKIANGANPADLPIEEPSQFELVINLKAAKSMGFEVPAAMRMRADQVIE